MRRDRHTRTSKQCSNRGISVLELSEDASLFPKFCLYSRTCRLDRISQKGSMFFLGMAYSVLNNKITGNLITVSGAWQYRVSISTKVICHSLQRLNEISGLVFGLQLVNRSPRLPGARARKWGVTSLFSLPEYCPFVTDLCNTSIWSVAEPLRRRRREKTYNITARELLFVAATHMYGDWVFQSDEANVISAPSK